MRSAKSDRVLVILHYAPIVETVRGRAAGDLSLPRLLAAGGDDRPLSGQRDRARPRPSRRLRGAHAGRHPGLQRGIRHREAGRASLRAARGVSGSYSVIPSEQARAESIHPAHARIPVQCTGCRL